MAGLLSNLLLPNVEKNEHYNHIKVLSYEQGCWPQWRGRYVGFDSFTNHKYLSLDCSRSCFDSILCLRRI